MKKAPVGLTGSSVTYSAASGAAPVLSTWTYRNLLINGGTSSVFRPKGDLAINESLSVVTSTLAMASTYSASVTNDVRINGGTLNLNTSTLTLSGNWTFTAGKFDSGSSTVTFQGAADSTLTGSTTFYNFACAVAGKTLLFQNGVVQVVNGKLTLTGASGNRLRLRSTNDSNAWFIKLTGLQNVGQVDVKDSDASAGNTIYAGRTSNGVGVNPNWIFAYLLGGVTDFTATAQPNGDILLTWSAPLDADENPLGSGSQYVIEWATYTVDWTTSSVGDTTSTGTWQISIAANGDSAGSPQSYTTSGLYGGLDYSFRLWTMDSGGTWSLISNSTDTTVTSVLSISLAPVSYNFGAVHITSTVVSGSSITVTNGGNVTETYSLSINRVAGSTWTVVTALPTVYDAAAFFGRFNGNVQPSSTTFTSSDIITPTPQAADATHFAMGETGARTTAGSPRGLWLRLDMPPTTATIQPQQFDLTVTAATP